MTVHERIRLSSILEKMRNNITVADRLGLRDISKITDKPFEKEKVESLEERR